MMEATLDEATRQALCRGHVEPASVCPDFKHLVHSTGSVPRICLLVAMDFERDHAHVADEDRMVCTDLPTKVPEHMNVMMRYVQLRVGWADSLADLDVDQKLKPELESAAARNGLNIGEGPGELPARYFIGRCRYRF